MFLTVCTGRQRIMSCCVTDTYLHGILKLFWQYIGNIVPRMTIKTLLQPLLIQIVTYSTPAITSPSTAENLWQPQQQCCRPNSSVRTRNNFMLLLLLLLVLLLLLLLLLLLIFAKHKSQISNETSVFNGQFAYSQTGTFPVSAIWPHS